MGNFKFVFEREYLQIELVCLNSEPRSAEYSLCWAGRRHDTQDNDTQQNNIQHKGLICETQHDWQSGQIDALFDIRLSVVMLNVVMLNVVMLNVVMLNVVMLNVVAPSGHPWSWALYITQPPNASCWLTVTWPINTLAYLIRMPYAFQWWKVPLDQYR